VFTLCTMRRMIAFAVMRFSPAQPSYASGLTGYSTSSRPCS
jgi:hypothetical protein